MKKLFGSLFGILALGLIVSGGYPGNLDSKSTDDATGYVDDGDIVARFSNYGKDKATITVYYDGVEYKRKGEPSTFQVSEVFIAFSDVTKLNSWGTNFLIRAADGSSIEFQVLNGIDGGKLKRKMKDLIREAGGRV